VKRLTWWILVLPLAAVAVIFAVMNRTPVALDLWPLPWQIAAPAFLILLGSLVVGLVIGLLLALLTGGARRRRNRQYVQANERQAIEIRELRRQLADAKRAASENAPVATTLPATRPTSVPAPLGAADPSARPALVNDRSL
jgi:putative membrane protein